MKTFHSLSFRPCTNKDLAVLYGISERLMGKWLRLYASFIGPKQGRYFTSRQVKIIFELFGDPV